MINQFRDRLEDLKTKRNYAQSERDIIEQFYSNTRKEIDEARVNITNQETEAQQLEDNHRVEVKVYLQKVKHLEYDQRITNKRINLEADKTLAAEDEYHENRLRNMKDDKHKSKKEHHENEKEQQTDVRQQQVQQEKTLKKQAGYYDAKIENQINNYEELLRKLKAELELKIKVWFRIVRFSNSD